MKKFVLGYLIIHGHLATPITTIRVSQTAKVTVYGYWDRNQFRTDQVWTYNVPSKKHRKKHNR